MVPRLAGGVVLLICGNLHAQSQATDLQIFQAAEVVVNAKSNTLYQLKSKQPTLVDKWVNTPAPFIGTNSGKAFLYSARGQVGEFFQVVKLSGTDMPENVLFFAPLNGSEDAFRMAPVLPASADRFSTSFIADKWGFENAARFFPTNTQFSAYGLSLVGSELSVYFRLKVAYNPSHQGAEPEFLSHVCFNFSLQQPNSSAAQLFANVRLESGSARVYGTIPYGEWVDVFASHKRPYTRLYVNGALVMEKETNADTFDNVGSVYFGQPRSFSAGAHYLTDFALDDVLIFDRALTPLEASQLAAFKF